MNWRDILKKDIEVGSEFEKVWFRKKPQQETVTRTPEQQDKINIFSRIRGVTPEQAVSWLYQNNWKMPQDTLIAYKRTPSGSDAAAM